MRGGSARIRVLSAEWEKSIEEEREGKRRKEEGKGGEGGVDAQKLGHV